MIEYENLKKVNEPFFEEFKIASLRVIESGWYILGKEVEKFEKEFSSLHSINHSVGVASGLDALTLSLKALDLNKGDEVLVPSNTYIATILSILQNDLKPILIEPDIHTYNIDPNLIEKKITKNTKAIIIVHLYGKPCDMDPILEIVKKHKLFLIEDCAQAHGAMYNEKIVGTFGDMGAFSFYPTKNLGALGDGGAIVTDDSEYYNKLLMLRNYGSRVKYYNEVVGYNSRLDEIQASFLSIKLAKLNAINNHKQKLAKIYNERISAEKFIKPVIDKKTKDVYHIYNIRCKSRDHLRDYLLKNLIKTEIHYPVSPSEQNCMKNILGEDYPISKEIHNTTLSLPISYCHSEDDIHKVCDALDSYEF